MSDRSGWWNPYEVGVDCTVRALCPWAEEFAWPPCERPRSTYGRLEDGRLAVLHGGADWRLDLLNPDDGTLAPLGLPYDSWRPTLSVCGRLVAGVAGAPDAPASVVAVEVADGRHSAIRRSAVPPVEYVSEGVFATFTGRDGHEVHVIVHPPRNPGYRVFPDEPVPYLLCLNEAPAAQTTRMLDPVVMFFTSRGLGVAEICPRGSAGFGRPYREQLFGRWGVADVEDCAVAVRGLVEHWNADPARLAIRGRGAGGATALGVLAGTDLCAAATVHAPIIDLGSAASPIAGYLRRLAADSVVFRAPSWVERIRRPVLLFHGSADAIVSPAQTMRLKETLRSRHVPHACLIFSGEGHTFQQAGTIERALEAELSFYGQTLGFDPYDTPRLPLQVPMSGVPSGLGWPATAVHR